NHKHPNKPLHVKHPNKQTQPQTPKQTVTRETLSLTAVLLSPNTISGIAAAFEKSGLEVV
ncbi:MAG: hypothetical protein OXI96_05320, partial [Acidimicrobiaceae bacterium]|nr:hypothetical protein [Acidimicrobiaceae bacterium]